MIRLDGQTVLITGAASGIGAALARRFALRGAHVVVADIDPDGQEVAAEVNGLFVHTDVTRMEDNLHAVEAAVDRFGRLDVAVLNAGLGEQGSFVGRFRPDHYRELVAVNLDGVVYGMHAALEVFTPQHSGHVLVTASLAGVAESPINPLYSATKHAVVGLVRSVAPLVADGGIRINALCPTFVDTPILRGAGAFLTAHGLAVLHPDKVADVAEVVLAGQGTGEAWPVVPHGEPAPIVFPEPPVVTVDPEPVDEAP